MANGAQNASGTPAPAASHSGGHVVSARATTIGLMAILLWSFMAGTVRIVSENFGATLGSALIYTVGGNSGLDWHAAVQHIAANPLPYALAFVGALAWSVYAVFTPAMSHGVDGTSLFFPCVAVALWIIHFASGQGWPAEPPSLVAWLFVLIAAAAIGGGYACWGYGILHGSMERLAIASYATPVLSTGASAVLLGLALSLPFWCGALLVAVGSVLNYLVSARK